MAPLQNTPISPADEPPIGWRNTAWLIFLITTYVTRIEVPPTTAIGDRARLGPASTVTRDVPAGAVVAATPSRTLRANPSPNEPTAEEAIA